MPYITCMRASTSNIPVAPCISDAETSGCVQLTLVQDIYFKPEVPSYKRTYFGHISCCFFYISTLEISDCWYLKVNFLASENLI